MVLNERTLISQVLGVFSMSLQSDWRLEGTEFDSASALCGFGVSQVNFGD